MCSEAQGRVNLYDENMSLMQSCWSNAICAVFRVTLFLWATFLVAFLRPARRGTYTLEGLEDRLEGLPPGWVSGTYAGASRAGSYGEGVERPSGCQ